MSVRFCETISAAKTLKAEDGVIPRKKARHQIDAVGTGTVAISVDFYSGEKTVYTIDATGTALPYALEGEINSITLTPSASAKVAYCAEEE